MATTKTWNDQQIEADPPSPDDELKRTLYLLKLCRYFDERMEMLYRQGKLPGAIYSGRGQEGRTSASSSPAARGLALPDPPRPVRASRRGST